MLRRWVVRPLAQADIEGCRRVVRRTAIRIGLTIRWRRRTIRWRRRSGPDTIRDTRLQFPEISAAVRRALLHRFPYAIYFRVTEESVVILAVLHLRRDPRTAHAHAGVTPLTVAPCTGALEPDFGG
jgi:plasmid stabilization system protein ParE